nr:Dihydrofolate reductase [uncultured bacterium]AIA15821.1 Dihydrofolate reductase [uncultured bacterium]
MNVIIVAATSIDGFIARDTTELADWTGSEDKKVFVELTKRAGVVVMGSTTYKTIGHPLKGRRNIVYSRSDTGIAVEDNNLEITQELPANLISRLEAEGHTEVAICGGSEIYDMFLQAGVVDEIYLTVVPTVFGTGVPLFKNPIEQNLKLISQRDLGNSTLLLQYEVTK